VFRANASKPQLGLGLRPRNARFTGITGDGIVELSQVFEVFHASAKLAEFAVEDLHTGRRRSTSAALNRRLLCGL
jgi:hypothetical protein